MSQYKSFGTRQPSNRIVEIIQQYKTPKQTNSPSLPAKETPTKEPVDTNPSHSSVCSNSNSEIRTHDHKPKSKLDTIKDRILALKMNRSSITKNLQSSNTKMHRFSNTNTIRSTDTNKNQSTSGINHKMHPQKDTMKLQRTHMSTASSTDSYRSNISKKTSIESRSKLGQSQTTAKHSQNSLKTKSNTQNMIKNPAVTESVTFALDSTHKADVSDPLQLSELVSMSTHSSSAVQQSSASVSHTATAIPENATNELCKNSNKEYSQLNEPNILCNQSEYGRPLSSHSERYNNQKKILSVYPTRRISKTIPNHELSPQTIRFIDNNVKKLSDSTNVTTRQTLHKLIEHVTNDLHDFDTQQQETMHSLELMLENAHASEAELSQLRRTYVTLHKEYADIMQLNTLSPSTRNDDVDAWSQFFQ